MLFNNIVARIATLELRDFQKVFNMAEANKAELTRKEKSMIDKIGEEMKESAAMKLGRRRNEAKTVLECITFVLGGEYDFELAEYIDRMKREL